MGEGPTSKLTHQLVGRVHFLPRGWTQGLSAGLPSHQVAPAKGSSLLWVSWLLWKGDRAAKVEAPGFSSPSLGTVFCPDLAHTDSERLRV